MTAYEQYSRQIITTYDLRYPDFCRYVKDSEINDAQFRVWLRQALENILYVFTIIEESPEKQELEFLYNKLLKTLLEIIVRMN